MSVRTRVKPRSSNRKKDHIYDVTRYLGPGGPRVGYMDETGRQIRESIPKNIWLPAISNAGHLVNIAIGTNPMDRNFRGAQALATRQRRQDEGFIWAHECPLGRDILHPEDEQALFGDDKPCHDHESGFVVGQPYKPPLKLCKHLERIKQLRHDAHTRNMNKLNAVSPRDTQAATLKALEAIASNMETPARTRKTKSGG